MNLFKDTKTLSRANHCPRLWGCSGEGSSHVPALRIWAQVGRDSPEPCVASLTWVGVRWVSFG